MYSDTIEALKKCGFIIVMSDKNLIKIGKRNYLVKSVYSHKNHLDEILISLAQNKAYDAMKFEKEFSNDKQTEQ